MAAELSGDGVDVSRVDVRDGRDEAHGERDDRVHRGEDSGAGRRGVCVGDSECERRRMSSTGGSVPLRDGSMGDADERHGREAHGRGGRDERHGRRARPGSGVRSDLDHGPDQERGGAEHRHGRPVSSCARNAGASDGAGRTEKSRDDVRGQDSGDRDRDCRPADHSTDDTLPAANGASPRPSFTAEERNDLAM